MNLNNFHDISTIKIKFDINLNKLEFRLKKKINNTIIIPHLKIHPNFHTNY
jgi:hypothetical protein